MIGVILFELVPTSLVIEQLTTLSIKDRYASLNVVNEDYLQGN